MIVVVSPFALQLTAVAELTLTVDGPVITKSDPFAATELHKIGSANVNVIDDGVHPGGVTAPIAIAGAGTMVNGELLPAATCLHWPSNVFPSDPDKACTW